MARTSRFPGSYHASGATPRVGKAKTSRRLRRRARLALEAGAELAPHRQDRNRGNAGSRSPDHGWKFFGDGRMGFNAALEVAARRRAR